MSTLLWEYGNGDENTEAGDEGTFCFLGHCAEQHRGNNSWQNTGRILSNE